MYSLARKFAPYAKILLSYQQGREICDYLPSHLWIEPTNSCNLDCTICPGHHSIREKGFMSFELFRNILDQALNAPVVYLFMAGESLLHPDIFKMIRYTNEKSASSNLFTNATLLDDMKARKLLDSELDWLGFSFDGTNKATYERIRRKADFEETLANIEEFLNIKRNLRKKRPYTCLSLIEPLELTMETTPHSKERFKKHLFSLGLDQFDVYPPHNWAGKIQEFPSGERRKKAVGTTRCPAPWSSLTVLWDGRVVPCCFDIDAEYVVGDISKSALREIWNGSPMQLLRKSFSQGKADMNPLCRSCHIPHDSTFLSIPRKVWVELFEMVKIRFSHFSLR